MESRPHLTYITFGAIASLAFVVACVCHEAIGHGGMCGVLGGQVEVLTSVYFRCSKPAPLIDAAGPLMNLAAGLAFLGGLQLQRRLSRNWQLFLVFGMAFNLFWGAGYFLFSAITNRGDWAFVLRDSTMEPVWLWRCGMGLLGAVLYYGSMRLVSSHLPTATPLILPYLCAGTLACVAVLFFHGPVLPALREAAQEGFGAGIGLLLVDRQQAGRPPSGTVSLSDDSALWLLISAAVIVAFLATLGRGL